MCVPGAGQGLYGCSEGWLEGHAWVLGQYTAWRQAGVRLGLAVGDGPGEYVGTGLQACQVALWPGGGDTTGGKCALGVCP